MGREELLRCEEQVGRHDVWSLEMISPLQIGRVETGVVCGDGFVGWRELKTSLDDVAAKARVDVRNQGTEPTRKGDDEVVIQGSDQGSG